MSYSVARCSSTTINFRFGCRQHRRSDGDKIAARFDTRGSTKWQRNSEEDYSLATSNPFLDTSQFVGNRCNERQNWKFRSDITGRVARPIDLRITKMQTTLAKVAGNRRDIALSPAPAINVRLI